jgi:hypothetical protein
VRLISPVVLPPEVRVAHLVEGQWGQKASDVVEAEVTIRAEMVVPQRSNTRSKTYSLKKRPPATYLGAKDSHCN